MRYALTAICIIGTVSIAQAQPITVEREKVLGRYGSVTVEDIPVPVTSLGPGEVATQSVPKAGAGAIRVHFRVTQPGIPGSWSVVVRGGSRQWEHVPEDGETEFWSDEFPGAAVTVVIVSSIDRPGVELKIDRIAVATHPTVPKSIVGRDDRKRWDTVTEPFRTLGRSVVRLRFVDDAKGLMFVCTGWLVFNSRHILTNEHCINSDQEMRSALADVDFNQGAAPTRTVRFRRLLMSDSRLDFSLLELEQPLDRPALALGSATTATNQALGVVQHPAGEPKQLSERDCLVSLTPAAGVTADLTDFEHACDTLGGSSGSPVFDRVTLKVVGLHHLGFLPGDKPVNRAVSIAPVLAAIRGKLPDLAKNGPQ